METEPRDPRPQHHRLKKMLTIIGLIILLLLGAFIILGLIPGSTTGLASTPEAARTYEEALARFEMVEQEEKAIVNDSGHSILLTQGRKTPRVYVMIHGTTNSPLQWLELGQTLHQQGHNVLILRMPYHGLSSHQVSELKQLTPQDLGQYADTAVDVAAGLGDEVDVIGLSGGAAVAAWMAQNRPEVDRALLLAPFLGIHGVPDFANRLLMNAFGRLPNLVFDNPKEPQRDWVYRGEATRGVAAFLQFGHQVVASVQDGQTPQGQIFVVTTASDDTANNSATAKIVDQWRELGADVTTFEFPKSEGIPHNSVDPAADPDKKQEVYNKILSLLGENPGS